MKPQQKERAPGGFSVHDALYIVFKHKWKILLLSLIGFSVAGVMGYRMMREPSYISVAKLMVRYVVERATIDPEAGSQMMSGGMLTEVEILTSRDTAVDVASAVGPEKLLPEAATPPTATAAADIIGSGLKVESPGPMSNMLYLTYRSSDPKLTTEVLAQIIQTYFKKHLDLHRNTEMFSQVSKQTDEARSNLRQTEEEINQLKEKSKVLTIDETMKEFEMRRQTTKKNQMETESQLAEQMAKVAALQRSQAAMPDRKGNEDPLATTEEPGAENPTATAEEVEAERKHSVAVDEYNDLAAQLLLLQQRRNELLINRKPSDPALVTLSNLISQVRKRGLDLVEQFPDLARKRASNQSGRSSAPVLSLEEEKYLESGLKAKLDSIKAQSKNLETEVTRISSLGFQLQDLERRRQLEEEKYRYFQSSLEKAILDEKLDPSKIPNIKVMQSPTPPLKSIDTKDMKLVLAIAFSGLGMGLALAFLIEMVIDRRVSRPIEISTRLQLPLMLSIPYIRSKDRIAKLIGDYPALEPAGDGGELILPSLSRRNDIRPADKSGEHFIAPYVAAIHDRITFNFQVNNINHKPKLVALTGLSEGAGTSTIAAGLAKAFAENGERKVLLVNLNAESGESHGHPADSLFKAVELSRSERFRLAPRNLYFASASTRRDSKDSHALAPTALHEIMPHLVASDFDYIIFDMPPVGPTSPTLTMAGFMDKVLLVLDGDNTTRENLSWGYMELEKAKADVSCIFNKARSHAPRWVQGDL
jgi:uncharacterized protein involved in exopolysaccharide biosynthesis/Mrp family chromosome partitioning ATPase